MSQLKNTQKKQVNQKAYKKNESIRKHTEKMSQLENTQKEQVNQKTHKKNELIRKHTEKMSQSNQKF